jgi:hypothetical protein
VSEAVVLALVAAWCFLVALAGGLVGLVLGNIRLPVLLLAGGNPATVAGANIAVSGVAALTAAVAHVRHGRVDWRLAAWMAPASAAGAIVGGLVSGSLPADTLRVVIGLLLLAFGIDTLRPRLAAASSRPAASVRRAAVLGGAFIGLLGGIVGLILGALRMPLLLGRIGLPPVRAVGTNMVVGVVVGASGLVGHLPSGVDWPLFAVGAAASVPGALLGARLTGRLSARALLRAVGVVLIVAGGALLVQAAVD